MAELWHNELDAPEDAIWACEEILAHAPHDKEALYRLQQILEEQERWQELFESLERELGTTAQPDAKVKIIRRMARLAERELADDDRAIELWNQLSDLRPSLELTDRLISLFERTGRYEEMSAMLSAHGGGPQDATGAAGRLLAAAGAAGRVPHGRPGAGQVEL